MAGMADLARAVAIAIDAHALQRDKSGLPYLLHPLRLAERLQSQNEKIVAVLHDVLEDTDYTADRLSDDGFAPAVIAAVRALTRGTDESYASFIVRLSTDPLAAAVKRADLIDNFNLPRTLLRPNRLEKDLSRLARYALSFQLLAGELDESAYRSAMGRVTAGRQTDQDTDRRAD